MAVLDFAQRPMLVFWETTRACQLACRHCRAEAIPGALPGELDTLEGKKLLDSLTVFGRPYPVIIFTGGDVLMRPDAMELLAYARRLGLPVGVAPSVTDRLTDAAMQSWVDQGVHTVSVSLDGATPRVHDLIRGVDGHFVETLRAIERLCTAGLTVQVNTTVMRDNVTELPAIAEALVARGVGIWEVFFLIRTGRGQRMADLNADACEDVCHFLVDASRYGMVVRTVEAPFFRRIVLWRESEPDDESVDRIAGRYQRNRLYRSLAHDLRRRLGSPRTRIGAQTKGTRDGHGIVFVGYDGTVYPAGFLPVPLGNVRETPLVKLYRDHFTMRTLHGATWGGRCGRCEFRDLCGGSRARAYAAAGDYTAEDPACVHVPL